MGNHRKGGGQSPCLVSAYKYVFFSSSILAGMMITTHSEEVVYTYISKEV